MNSFRTMLFATAAAAGIIAAAGPAAVADVAEPLHTPPGVHGPIILKPLPSPTPRPKVKPSGRGSVPQHP
jgi:hypothetical protein